MTLARSSLFALDDGGMAICVVVFVTVCERVGSESEEEDESEDVREGIMLTCKGRLVTGSLCGVSEGPILLSEETEESEESSEGEDICTLLGDDDAMGASGGGFNGVFLGSW